jgi:hypothetical protein
VAEFSALDPAQQYFNGAQLSHGEANLTRGALVKPIDNLTGADFSRTFARSRRSHSQFRDQGGDTVNCAIFIRPTDGP